MKMKSTILLFSLLGLFGLPALADDLATEGKKTSTVKVIFPDRVWEECQLKIDGNPTKAKGPEREFTTPPLVPGKTYEYTLEALIVPNNYTKITRVRTIQFKAGETVTVDMRIKDKVNDKVVVRWVPTPDDIVDKMASMAKIGKDDIVYDLGCGDAVMLIRPIKLLHAKKGVGIDIDPKMIEKAKEKAKEEGVADKVDLRVGDIMDVKDLSDATVVLLYIGDDLGEIVSPVLQKTLKPGARVVSHRFSLGDWKPDEKITVKGLDGDDYDLLIWTVKEKK